MKRLQLRGIITVFAALSFSGVAIAEHPACRPDAEVEAALERFSLAAGQYMRSTGGWDGFVAQLEAVIEQQPTDVYLNRRLQDLYRPNGGVLVDRYRRLATENPTDPASQYLYGRALSLAGRGADGSWFDAALAIDEDYPWAHLALAHLYESVVPDADRARFHILAFVDVCPDSSLAGRRLSEMSDPEVIRGVAGGVRASFAAAPDLARVGQLGALWTAEFRVLPPQEHPAVREKIALDLARIRELNVESDEPALGVLLQGYEFVGDDTGLTWTVEAMARRFPRNPAARRAAMQQFHLGEPPPGGSDESAEGQAYLARYAAAARRWCELWPDDPEAWLARFRAESGLQRVTEEELLATVDALLEIGRHRPDFRTEPLVPFQVAQTLVERGFALDRVPGFVEEGFAQLETGAPRLEVTTIESAHIVTDNDRERDFEGWIGREALFDAYLAQDELERARDALEVMERSLPEEPGPGIDADRLGHLRANLLTRRALLARAEGRTADALADLQGALELGPIDAALPCETMADLLRELGASDEAVDASSATARPRSTLVAESRNIELPDFEFRDLSGRLWTPADLRGKVALVTVWATWCPPCLVELPVLQKLHERVRERDDMIVLTLNVDQQPGVVQPVMKRYGYDFPVVFAFDYIYELWGHEWLIPCTWIVDSEGIVKYELIGLDGTNNETLDEAIRSMARVASESGLRADPPATGRP